MVISLCLNKRKSDTMRKPSKFICKNSVKQKEMSRKLYFALVFVILWVDGISMKLKSPFFISSRLAPAVKVADATLSFSDGKFILESPDFEHEISGFRFPRCRISGDTDESVLQDGFVAILDFLYACAESRKYATRQGKDPMDGENSDLFPANVGEWAEMNSDELSMLSFGLQETDGLISE